MARKLINNTETRLKSDKFLSYLKKKLGNEVFVFLNQLSSFSDVFVFSGVIRNYFIKYNGSIRDFDLVLDGNENLIEEYLSKFLYTKNSFGGYKILLDNIKIDIWHIENTWAYSNYKVDLQIFKDYNLPNTAFFNFSSVIFDFNNSEFIYNSSFKNFLDTKKLDLVLEDNPLPQLCLVNTIYYMQKFHLGIADRLKNYYVRHFCEFSEEDYGNVQLKHFNEVKFSYPYLKEYYKIFQKEIGADNVDHK